VAKGEAATVTVANTLNPPSTPTLGALRISKTLSGAPADYKGSFSFGYSCSVNGQSGISGTVSMVAGDSATVYNVPSGSVCTVTEILPDAPPGYTWSTPVITGSPTGSIGAGSVAGVTVANQLNPLPVEPATVTPVAPEAVSVPEAGTVPTTVAVPEAATIPTGVPAGDGSQWPTQGPPLLAMVLLAVGGFGIAGARIRLRREDGE
jgi:hypothetical protein